MATPTEDEELGRSIDRLLAGDGVRSCRVGTSRFRDFAATGPVSLGALERKRPGKSILSPSFGVC
jgi:hypothetical protein